MVLLVTIHLALCSRTRVGRARCVQRQVLAVSVLNCGGRSCCSSASWSDVYGGYWKNLLSFLRECVLRSRGRFSPRKSGHCFYKEYLAVRQLQRLWEEFFVFST